MNKNNKQDDNKPKKQLSSSISSLRFMNRNKPPTSDALNSTTNQQSPPLSFKSSTSRVVKTSSTPSLKTKQSNPNTPQPTPIINNNIPKTHKAEHWSYSQEGKLDQVISNTLANYSVNTTNQQELLSSTSYACQEDNESIYSLNFYRQLEGEATEESTSDYVRGGRLKFGTYKQEEIAITTEIDPSNSLKRKKDGEKIGKISTTQSNKKKKYKNK